MSCTILFLIEDGKLYNKLSTSAPACAVRPDLAPVLVSKIAGECEADPQSALGTVIRLAPELMEELEDLIEQVRRNSVSIVADARQRIPRFVPQRYLDATTELGEFVRIVQQV